MSDDEELLNEARDKLSSAKYLLDGHFYKDAVSRAYYAMFYAAKAILSLRAIYPRTHSGVIAKFGLEFVKDGWIDKTYGRSIRDAADMREHADYSVGIIITKEEPDTVITEARDFITRIEEAIRDLKK